MQQSGCDVSTFFHQTHHRKTLGYRAGACLHSSAKLRDVTFTTYPSAIGSGEDLTPRTLGLVVLGIQNMQPKVLCPSIRHGVGFLGNRERSSGFGGCQSLAVEVLEHSLPGPQCRCAAFVVDCPHTPLHLLNALVEPQKPSIPPV